MMDDNQETNSRLAQRMATELLEAVRTGEAVDQELIDEAESIISVHQLLLQLLFVGMIVDRIPQLVYYNDVLDTVITDLDEHDLAEADIPTKIRAASVIASSIKTNVDLVNNMMASKDAVGMLIASLKDQFGPEVPIAAGDKNFMERLQKMPAEQRQRILAGAVTAIKRTINAEENAEEVND